MVAPPEFSVLYQVYEDFKSGGPPLLSPGQAASPAGDVVGSADYADMAKEKVRASIMAKEKARAANEKAPADQVQSLPERGLSGAVFIPMERLAPTMHMENSDVSPEQLYVQYWDRFVGY